MRRGVQRRPRLMQQRGVVRLPLVVIVAVVVVIVAVVVIAAVVVVPLPVMAGKGCVRRVQQHAQQVAQQVPQREEDHRAQPLPTVRAHSTQAADR